MFYEELDFIKVDPVKLKADLIKRVLPLGDLVVQGEEYETPQYRGFGGWSITSRTGDWRDGWEFFQTPDGDENFEFVFQPENRFAAKKFFNLCHSIEHKNPTQAYVGEIAYAVDQMAAMGLTPRRVRVTCLKAGCKSLVHRDGADDEYICRIHIPIVTNPKCVFICQGQHLHMEAGKVYAVWVNTWHQIRNDSNEDRYHIICDFYDTNKITKHFKYHGDFRQLEIYVEEQRKLIDAAVVTDEIEQKFLELKAKYRTKNDAKS